MQKSPAIQQQPKLDFIEEKHVLHALAWAGVKPGTINSITELPAAAAPVRTVGKFYECTLVGSVDRLAADPENWMDAQPKWETCYHPLLSLTHQLFWQRA